MKWLNGYRMRMVFVGMVAAMMFGGTELVKGATITVGPGEGCDFGTIQAGIDTANDGDTVLVVSGEYVITEPVTFRGKAITVKSEAGPNETIIKMGAPANPNRASVVIFENNETTESVLEGFTITGGKGCWIAGANAWVGGGIYFQASSGTVKNCAIVSNNATNGGGVVCEALSSPILIDCIVAENSAEEQVGGVFAVLGASITLSNCVIGRNSAKEYAGGASCWSNSSLTLDNCIITDNSAGLTFGGVGGSLNSFVIMTNCIVTGNTAETGVGGGIHFSESSAELTNCVITKNTAGSGGGGVSCAYASYLSIRNCTIWGNSTTGNYYPGFAGGGVGCFSGSSAEITNSIIWGNTSPRGEQIGVTQEASTLTVVYSNIASGQAEAHVEGGCTLDWGEGNIDVDPCFADPDNADYHLKSEAGRWNPNSQTWIQDNVTSPCIDAGDPMSPVGWELFPNGGFVNMGAYGGTSKASKSYFGEPVCETIVAGDINGDGQVNRADLEIMALHWTDHEPLPLP